ncbi:hypothetical protein M9H77_23152 [Catharanthus roseus]|uniref:Uncharacterized protein n=1 Tax=Catharanthus roseus TaxID=4058 RepID=A0ACC0ATF4_CATRO|nr:hypothetical protein M9H77_23152 [Catharanthus roseus]
MELIDEWDRLRRFISQFLSTTRDSVDRARVELQSRPGYFGSQCTQAENMLGSQSPNHADEAVSESSQNRQFKPIREATPHPEQATHKTIENFMIKMKELLETSMDIRRNERVPATEADEALERFLKFRPPEFYGEVEQEIKPELFLEQLNDIYDTLKVRGMAKDWWLRASEARTLKNQPWTWKIFKKNSKRNTYLVGLAKYCLRLIDTDENKTRQFVKRLRVELQRALAPLPSMGFVATVEAATQMVMADQARRPPINVLDKDHGNLEISRDPMVNKGLEMKAD